MLEQRKAAGCSPSRELLWSSALKNPQVQELLRVLRDVGPHRAMAALLQSSSRSAQKATKGECQLKRVRKATLA